MTTTTQPSNQSSLTTFGVWGQWSYFAFKLVGGLVVFALGMLYANQDKILYIPNPPGFNVDPADNPSGCRSPEEWSTNGKRCRASDKNSIPFEEKMVTTSDGKKIHTWLLLQPNSRDVPTLIYFHGNAGNMGYRLSNAASMYAKIGINILMMDYRGYGRSTGSPSEIGLNLDADAVLEYAATHPKLINSPMIAFGRSLGGAVSVALAARHPDIVKGIILENTFLSIGAMVDILMPFLTVIKPFVLNIKWDSDAKMPDLIQPVLFISGDADQLVPPLHMKQLFEKATLSTNRQFFSVSGGGHNDTFMVAVNYYQRIHEFLEQSFSSFRGLCSGTQNNGGQDDGESKTTISDGAEPEPGDGADNSISFDDAEVVDGEEIIALPTMATDFSVK